MQVLGRILRKTTGFLHIFSWNGKYVLGMANEDFVSCWKAGKIVQNIGD